jgi:hypothetical protein
MTGSFGNGMAGFTFHQTRTDESFQQWQATVWGILHDAAQSKYFTGKTTFPFSN